MKKIGLVGGLGPESTLDYYKAIIERFKSINTDGSLNYPEMVIYSVNMSVFIDHLKAKRYHEATEYIAEAVENLRKAGAAFAAITANTPHLLFDQIQNLTSLPLISIVKATADFASSLSLKRAGLIGTGFTMKSTFFKSEFAKCGIEVVTPSEEEMNFINQKLFEEIELGIYSDETRSAILNIVETMRNRDGIDSIILGCTEFPIMFPNDSYTGVRFLNTTQIHIDQIIKNCLH